MTDGVFHTTPEVSFSICRTQFVGRREKTKENEGKRIFVGSVDEYIVQNIFDSTDLRFAGLLSLTDPPRTGVAEAVQKYKNAGIGNIMVTGDYTETALPVAQSIGVVTTSASLFEEEDAGA